MVLAIAPLVALSGWRLWDELREDEARVATERLQLAQAAAFATEAFLDGHVASARAVALHPLIARAGAPPGELQALVQRIAADHPEWEGVGLIGPDGYTVTGSRSAPSTLYLGDRPYFRRVLETGQPAVSSALVGRVSGKATVVVAVPVERSDARRGVLIAPLPTDRFGASLMAKVSAPSVALTVIDADAQAFIRPDRSDLTSLERLRGTEIDAVLAGEAGTLVAGAGGAAKLVAYAPVSKYGWGVLLAEPAASAFAPARRQALERGVVLAVILAVVFALGWILAGRIALYIERAERLSGDLQSALRTRDEFLASAAHDLRNPLATIQAAGEVLERASGRGATVAQEQLERCSGHILSASRRMVRLLDSFLDVAHLQIGRPLALDRRGADLVELVRQVVHEQQEATTRHTLHFEGPEDLIAEVDGPRLQRAIENLLSNAVKYSPEGGDIHVRLQATGRDVLLAVEDHGIGIPAEDRERIFDRFQRGANTEGRFTGSGIGLSAARQIVEQHGGTLSVTSELGKGSTFKMYLPGARSPA